MKKRQGFTAFELMIVLLIIIIIILLLLPAINAAREAARRNGCINQLRQLAISTINHESAMLRFPVANRAPAFPDNSSNLGRVVPGTRTTDVYANGQKLNHMNDGYSWTVQILPYIEEFALYDKISEASKNFKATAFSKTNLIDPADQNSHFATQPIGLLQCSSYAGVTRPQDPKNYGLPAQIVVAHTNYVAISAATRGVRKPNIVDDHDPRLGGVMISARDAKMRGLKIRDIADGTSKTTMITETLQQNYSSWYSGQSAWVLGFSPDKAPKIEKAGDGLPGISPTPAPENSTALKLAASDGLYAKTLAGEQRKFGPSSHHAGGVVNHAFADGHCVPIANSIDPTVYFRLITRGGGEPVDLF